MSGKDFGIMIEFTGTVNLTNGKEIAIIHDDGVSLMIGGSPVSGFGNGIGETLDYVTFTASTGSYFRLPLTILDAGPAKHGR
jgi:hypothetical protein